MAASRNLTPHIEQHPVQGNDDSRNINNLSHPNDSTISNNIPVNPFVGPDENSSFESQSPVDSRSSDEYGKPFTNYNGYYSQNGTTSNLLSHSSSNISALNNNSQSNLIDTVHENDSLNNLQVPAEYDRYPSLGGSRVVSSTSLNSQAFNNGRSNTQSMISDNSSMSNASANPFLATADFSPFGGYPASSFPLHIEEKEPDDYLHNPDPIADAEYEKNRFMNDLKNLDKRSLGGLIGFILLLLAAIAIFVILPVLTYTGVTDYGSPVTYEVLTNYKYPTLAAIRTSLIDPDTPSDVMSRQAKDGSYWGLVFSDEFNAEGRTFYSGDDQFFTAPNLNYAATKDLEWYDPDAVTTNNGTLILRMDAYKNHDLYYRSGMIQSWNQLCFTQGILEVSVRLPNYGNVTGLWPGLWAMGNLGRPGYMASTDGVWPYTYDSCDAGITPNQSSPDGISYLPGQKLNICTCPGEDHPNRGTGRGAPEIDALEGEVDTTIKAGVASQSMQIAPMDIWYMPDYNFVEVHNASITSMNTYAGGPFQQAVSATTTLNTSWYEYGDVEHHFQRYGFEYLNDNDDGYIRWFVGEDPTLTVHAYALAPIGNVGWRRITKEPMSLILNLGISNNWAYIDWPSIKFPVTMRLDYVRIYQPNDSVSITCDPKDYPTYDYIQDHLNAYEDNNLTSWKSAGYTFPQNNLTGSC